MILECLPFGMLESNSYLIGNQGKAVVIDCGVEESIIMEAAKKHQLDIKYIILTHCHIDHICHVEKLHKKTGAKLLVHELDKGPVANSKENLSYVFGIDFSYKDVDQVLKDGDIIEVGGLKLEVIHTPGHSLGGICIKIDNIVFTGDTLFRLGVGRTDFIHGNEAQLMNAIQNKLMVLNDNTTVYPGHGDSTTIGNERNWNSSIRRSGL